VGTLTLYNYVCVRVDLVSYVCLDPNGELTQPLQIERYKDALVLYSVSVPEFIDPVFSKTRFKSSGIGLYGG
jgi:hypothetical protein